MIIMTRHRRSTLSQLQRGLYLASRSAGDAQAINRGRYPQRLVRRHERRALLGWLRKIGL